MSAGSRTSEQITADDNLTLAIEATLRAYGLEEEYILTDYMVIAAQASIGADGEQSTAYSYMYRDSDLPIHKILGLLEVARSRAMCNIMQEGD